MRHRGIARIYLYPILFILTVIGFAVFRVVAWQWSAERSRTVVPSTMPALKPPTPEAIAPSRP